MAKPLVANNAYSTLASTLTAASTTISVASSEGARFPAATTGGDYFYATLIDTSNNLEIVKVTNRSGDTFTVVRAQDGTTAREYSAADRIELRPVAALLEDIRDGAIIADGSITYAKIQDVTADRLLGRTTAGAGVVEEVPLLDEDDMASDSATAVPTQQSVKAYVDAEVGAIPTASSGLSEVVEYTSSGTFTKASYTDARQFIVTAIGPGGDGADGFSSGVGGGGGGGGGGGVAVKRLAPADLAASISITIDATKAEFAHTTPVFGNKGGDGSSKNGGSGGTASGGDQNYTGQAGGNGGGGGGKGGTGGSTRFAYGIGGQGGPDSGSLSEMGGANGYAYGGGGGGGGHDGGNGGAGSGGAVIIQVIY